MQNLTKYWQLLESLKFPIMGESKSMATEKHRLEYNILKLEASLECHKSSFTTFLIKKWKLDNLLKKEQQILLNDTFSTYSLYSLYLLNEIIQHVNFKSSAKEDLVSEQHKLLIISCLQDISHWGLSQNLYIGFYEGGSPLFKKETDTSSNYYILQMLIEGCTPVICTQPLHVGKALDEVVLQYMAGLFSLRVIYETKDNETYVNINSYLQNIKQKLSKSQFLRNLMVLRSNNNIGKEMLTVLQKQLLLHLWSPGGFQALVFALNDANKNKEQNIGEIIARLVVQPAYSTKVQECLLKQILIYIQASLSNEELKEHLGVALLCLRRLCELNANNRYFVETWLIKQLKPLVQPQDNVLEVMAWSDFLHLISLIYHSFCTSTVECLPSCLLTNQLCLLLKLLHNILPYNNVDRLQNHLKCIIIRCLDNRTDSELETIIQSFIFEKYPTNWNELHKKIVFTKNALNCQELKIILSSELIERWEPVRILVEVLTTSSFNLLTFKIFLIIFRSLEKTFETQSSSDITLNDNTLLLTEEEMANTVANSIYQKYDAQIQVVRALEILVQYPPLKALICDNIKELLSCLVSCVNSIIVFEKYNNSSTIIILLILIKEIIESCSYSIADIRTSLIKPLTKLHTIIENPNIKYQISSALQMLQSNNINNNLRIDKDSSSKNAFEKARALLESKESYLQVEGIENFIKLIKSRDEVALSNGHIIMALVLTKLKSQESYTFLNCVRLFAALVHVMESEVIHILSEEYLNDVSSMDYRLVVGEVILKVCRELGPLCYKYKAILLNCFMSGCRSLLDEFRFSSYSNLGQLCRLLTYQVHQYFQELLHMIDCELSTGQYLPAKRASVMVLSELLEGVDNLEDYQELLLPLYRLLKRIAFLPNVDEKMRLHAINGLSCLSEKCKQLLKTLSTPSLHKEIRILSIKDLQKKQEKNHILEIN